MGKNQSHWSAGQIGDREGLYRGARWKTEEAQPDSCIAARTGSLDRLVGSDQQLIGRIKEHGLRAHSRRPSGPTHRAPRPHANHQGGSRDARPYNVRQRQYTH
jgi:hypothetical protein